MGEYFVACDIGNTSAAFALMRDGEVLSVASSPTAAVESYPNSLRGLFSGIDIGQFKSGISSVVPSSNDAALAALAEAGAVDPQVLSLVRDAFMPHQLSIPETVGTDRVLSAMAAYRRAGKSVIVVDIGTAVTVDCVNSGGVFMGGAILPGLDVWLRSLTRSTAQLPLVRIPVEPVPPIGANTEAAILAGALYGLSGAIDKLVRDQSECLDQSPEIYITGGSSGLLLRYMYKDFIHIPYLVFEGIYYSCLGRND